MEAHVCVEKTLEALLEQMIYVVGEKHAEECPIVSLMGETLSTIKTENNAQLLREFGLRQCPINLKCRRFDGRP